MKDRPLGYGVALAWALGAAVALLLLLQAFASLRPGARTDIVNIGAVEALVFVLGTFAVLTIHAPGRGARDALGLRATHPALPVFGLALGLSLQLPAEQLRQFVERYFPTSETELVRQALLLRGGSVLRVVLLLVVVACVGPLVEELFFRGALFGALRRSRTLAGAAVFTAIAFTMTHLDLKNWLPLLVVAGALSYLRAVAGSLLPCLALHVAFNSVTLIAMLTNVDSVTRPLHIGPVVGGFGWIVSGALLAAAGFVAKNSAEAERARAEDAA
jgi:CAAX protease family protein